MTIEKLQIQKEKLFGEREELIKALELELLKDAISANIEIEARIGNGWNSLTIKIKDSKSTWEFAEISYSHDRDASWRDFDEKDLPWKIEFKIKGHLSDGTATEKFEKSSKLMEYIGNIMSDNFKVNYFDKYKENSVEFDSVHTEIAELKKELEAKELKKAFNIKYKEKTPSDIMDALKNTTLVSVYKKYNNSKSIVGKAPDANIYYIDNKRTSKKKLLEFLEVNCFVEVVA